MDKILKSAREKISVGERLNFDEIIALYNENDLLYLAESARRVKEFISSWAKRTLSLQWRKVAVQRWSSSTR